MLSDRTIGRIAARRTATAVGVAVAVASGAIGDAAAQSPGTDPVSTLASLTGPTVRVRPAGSAGVITPGGRAVVSVSTHNTAQAASDPVRLRISGLRRAGLTLETAYPQLAGAPDGRGWSCDATWCSYVRRTADGGSRPVGLAASDGERADLVLRAAPDAVPHAHLTASIGIEAGGMVSTGADAVPVDLEVRRSALAPSPVLRLSGLPTDLLRGETYALTATVANVGGSDVGSTRLAPPSGFAGAIRVERLLPRGVAARWQPIGAGWTCNASGVDRAPACGTTDPTLPAGASTPPLRLTFTVAGDRPAAQRRTTGARQPHRWRIVDRGWYAKGANTATLEQQVRARASVRDVPGPATARSTGADPYLAANWTGVPRSGGHTPLRVTLHNRGRGALEGGARLTVALPRGARARAGSGRGWRCTGGAAPGCRLPAALVGGRRAAAVTFDVALPRAQTPRRIVARVSIAGRSRRAPKPRASRSVRDATTALGTAQPALAVIARADQSAVFEDITVVSSGHRRSLTDRAPIVSLSGTVLPANAAGVRIRWEQLCTTRRAVRRDRGCGGRIAPRVRWRHPPVLTEAAFEAPQVARTTRLRFRFTARTGGARASTIASVRVLDKHQTRVRPSQVGRVQPKLLRLPRIRSAIRLQAIPATRKAAGGKQTARPAKKQQKRKKKKTKKTTKRRHAATTAAAAPARSAPRQAGTYVSRAWCSVHDRAARATSTSADLRIGIARFKGTITLSGPRDCNAPDAEVRLVGDVTIYGESGPIVALGGVQGTIDRTSTRIETTGESRVRLFVDAEHSIDVALPRDLRKAVEIPFPTQAAEESLPLEPRGSLAGVGFPLPLPGGWKGAVAIGFVSDPIDEAVDAVSLNVTATATPPSGTGEVTVSGEIGLGLNTSLDLTDEQWGQLMEGMPDPGEWRLAVSGRRIVSLGQGCDVDVEGELSRADDEPLHASISGALSSPCRLTDGFTVQRAEVGWDSTDGVSVSGQVAVTVPGRAAPLSGGFAGTYRSADDWRLGVNVDPVRWEPAAGLMVNAGFEGTLRQTPAGVRFSVAAPFTMQGLGVVDITDAKVLVTSDCTTTIFQGCRDGRLNVVAHAVASLENGAALGLPRRVEVGGAITANGDFTLDASIRDWRYGVLDIHDTRIRLGTVNGQRQFSIDAHADLGEYVQDARLHADLTTGLYLFTAARVQASGLALHDLTLAYSASQPLAVAVPGFSAPVELPAKTFKLFGGADVPAGLAKALSALKIDGSLQLTGEVGFGDGFRFKGGLSVRPTGYLVGSEDPAQLSVRWQSLGLALDISVGGRSGASVSLSAGGRFQMHLPARPGEGAGQDLAFSVFGDIGLSADSGFAVTLSASLDSPWVNAFGWDGFTIRRFGLSVGVANGVPTFGADGQFAFDKRLGESLGAEQDLLTEFSFDINPTRPCLIGAVGTPGGKTALNPGRKDILLVSYARLTVAPRGCRGEPARIGFAFDGAILGTPVKVDVDVTPHPFSLRGHAQIGAFSVADGRMAFRQTQLTMLIDPAASRYEFSFDGGVDVLGANASVSAQLQSERGAVSLRFRGTVGNVALGALRIPYANVSADVQFGPGRPTRVDVSLEAEAEVLGARLTGYTGSVSNPVPQGRATFALDYQGGKVNLLTARAMVAGSWSGGYVRLRALGQVEYRAGRGLIVEAAGKLDAGSTAIAADVSLDSASMRFAVGASVRFSGSDCFRTGILTEVCASATFGLSGRFELTPDSWRLNGSMSVSLEGRSNISGLGFQRDGGTVTLIRGAAGFEAANRPPIRAYVDVEILLVFSVSVRGQLG